MGCLWPAFSCFLFLFALPLPGCCLTLLLSWEFHPNHGRCGFRAAEPFNLGVQLTVAVMGPPEALSKSLHIGPSIQILRTGKYALVANRISWSHNLGSQVFGQKAGKGWRGHGMGEEKCWRIRGGGCLERRAPGADVSLCCWTLRIHRCSHLSDGIGTPSYFREHSHFSETWKRCLKPSKRWWSGAEVILWIRMWVVFPRLWSTGGIACNLVQGLSVLGCLWFCPIIQTIFTFCLHSKIRKC